LLHNHHKKAAMFPSLLFVRTKKTLPDYNPFLRFFIQLIARLHIKSLVPAIHIYYRADGTVLAGRVGIGKE
jgi:hypothetical protein